MRKLSFLDLTTVFLFYALCFCKGKNALSVSRIILLTQPSNNAVLTSSENIVHDTISKNRNNLTYYASEKHLKSTLSTSHIRSGDIELNPGPNPQGDISVMHTNVRSLKKHIDLLIAESHQFDIITVSETWIYNESFNTLNSLQIPNFQPLVHLDRDDSYGGVAIYVRSNMACKARADLHVDGLEAVWIETRVNKETLLIGSFYRSPNRPAAYWDLISDGIRKANNTNNKFIILGDFNSDWLSRPCGRYVDILNLFHLHQLVSSPTRITSTTKSCVDHILVQCCDLIKCVDVLPPFCSDHSVPYASLQTRIEHKPTIKRQIFNYSKLDANVFCDKLNAVHWDEILQEHDIDTSAELFTKTFMDKAKQCMPIKTVKLRTYDAQWMTEEIRSSISKRKRLYKKAATTKNAEDMQIFRKYRNELITKIRTRKILLMNLITRYLIHLLLVQRTGGN